MGTNIAFHTPYYHVDLYFSILWDHLSKTLIRCLDLSCQEEVQICTYHMICLFQSYYFISFFYSCKYMPIQIVSCWRHAFVLVSHCLKLLFWCYLAGIITIHIFQLTILPWMVHYRYLQAEYNVHSNLLILHDLPFYMTLLCLPFDVLEQPAVGADGRKVEAQGNVLLASIENMQYAVTVDVLHTVSQIGGDTSRICFKILLSALFVLIVINCYTNSRFSQRLVQSKKQLFLRRMVAHKL